MGTSNVVVAVVVLVIALASLPSPATALVRGRRSDLGGGDILGGGGEGTAAAADAVADDTFVGSSDGALAADRRRSLLGMPNTHAKPDYSIYWSKTAAMAEVKRIVESNKSFMRLETMESTRDGYSSSLTVVTVEPGGFGSGDADKKTRVLYNYGEHGRELITVDVAVQLLRDLAKGVDHVAQLADSRAVRREEPHHTHPPRQKKKGEFHVREFGRGVSSVEEAPTFCCTRDAIYRHIKKTREQFTFSFFLRSFLVLVSLCQSRREGVGGNPEYPTLPRLAPFAPSL